MFRAKKGKTYDAIYVGRISPDRGMFDVIEIWKMVTRKEPKARLLIIGGGLPHYVQKLRELIELYKLSNNVTLTGGIEDKEKFSLMSRSKVFVLPSHNEGFCLVISEALSMGLPVVAYELPALLEVYGKYPAIFYVEKGCRKKFTDTILWLLRREDICKELSQKGTGYVKALLQKFSWEDTSNELLLLLKSLAS